MKAIQKIFERYPNVQKKFENPSDPNIMLTTQESVFYQLCLFLSKPEGYQFSLNMIHEYLRNDDLLFAFEVILEYFQKDTSFVREVSQTYYDKNLLNEQLVGQKGFAEMVEEKIPGIKFKPSMVHTYWKRGSGRVPEADLIIEGTPYWKVNTIESFIEREREYRKEKVKKRK